MTIEVRKASEGDKSIFRNLWEFYIYDFSELNPAFDVDDSGRFDRVPISYWTEAHLHPFLIYVDDKPEGFVLINQDGQVNRIGQFFVMRKYRRKGIGEQAVVESFNRFPGKWVVGVTIANLGAQEFWRKVINRYTQAKFEEQVDEKGIDFLFESVDPTKDC